MPLATEQVIHGQGYGQEVQVIAWCIWLAWISLVNDEALRVNKL